MAEIFTEIDQWLFWGVMLYLLVAAVDAVLRHTGGRGWNLMLRNKAVGAILLLLVAKLVALQAPTEVVLTHVGLGLAVLILGIICWLQGGLAPGFAKGAAAVFAYFGWSEQSWWILQAGIASFFLSALIAAVVRGARKASRR